MRSVLIPLIGLGIACSPRSHPMLTPDAATIQGITFAVDTTPEVTLQGPGPMRALGMRVTWAGSRGRVDVLNKPVRPVLRIGGVTVGRSEAMPGDYYLFDSTGFVLVRLAIKQYSALRISEAAFNYEGKRDGWPAFFPFAPTTIDTVRTKSMTTLSIVSTVSIGTSMLRRTRCVLWVDVASKNSLEDVRRLPTLLSPS